ncbi:MAG TPA: hypothetical protein VGI16_08650 [Candidatus Acidoferrum sp.]|jgi:hypothetical protein
MLTPQRYLGAVVEIIFVLLGGLVVWLGLTEHIFFDRHRLPWLVLSIALILWGLRAMYKPARFWVAGERWTRGISLTLLGIVMLAISRVPFLWVGRLLAVAGLLLVLRGLIGASLMLRSQPMRADSGPNR